MRLVLASSSLRRQELLALLGLSFEVCPSEFHEHPVAGLLPIEQVRHFALEKARSVACVRPRALVLGSDTVIDLDGRLLGKPIDLPDGRSHHVHTAVALCDRERNIEFVEVATTEVRMKADDGRAYERYLNLEESLGKAGAYAIQGHGGNLVEQIVGDYTTVVGLPLKLVAHLLELADYPAPVSVEDLYRCKPYANWNRFAA
jgi:septum formation protein